MPLTAVNSVIAEGSPSRVPRRPHFHTPLDEDYSQGPADSTDSGTCTYTDRVTWIWIKFICWHVLKSWVFFVQMEGKQLLQRICLQLSGNLALSQHQWTAQVAHSSKPFCTPNSAESPRMTCKWVYLFDGGIYSLNSFIIEGIQLSVGFVFHYLLNVSQPSV